MKILRPGYGFVFALTLCSLASAQATRTWVSGVGDDANPCSRTAPCKTFAGAISKTAAAGEINVLDPGGFGAVTITKSITIDGGGSIAGVLVSGTNGIVISASATDLVILRNLDIDGLNTGLNGVKINTAGTVILENDLIYEFTQNGIDIEPSSGSVNVAVYNCRVANIALAGVEAKGVTGQTTSATITGLRAYKTAPAVDGGANSNITISDSDLAFGGKGVRQSAAGSTINVRNSVVHGFTVQGISGFTGSTINVSGTAIAENVLGVSGNGGTVASDGTNVPMGNTSDGTFNGTINKY